MLMNIDSPYIVQLYGATLKDTLCIIMEYCEKGSLDTALKDPYFGNNWDIVFQVINEIVMGIKFLHENVPSILHRDLKSSNVLVTNENHCKIADFGISRYDTSVNISTLQKCRGTFAYISPEGFKSEKFVTASDIFSIGIIMWETINRCVKGKYELPYFEHNRKNEFIILMKVHNEDLRPSIPNIPNDLKTLLQKSWNNDKEARPTSDELLTQINHFMVHYNSNKDEWNTYLPNLS